MGERGGGCVWDRGGVVLRTGSVWGVCVVDRGCVCVVEGGCVGFAPGAGGVVPWRGAGRCDGSGA